MASILSKLCICRCVMTHDGLQAVHTVKTHPPGYLAAIFMDIHMSECDGITAMKMIGEREREVPPPGGACVATLLPASMTIGTRPAVPISCAHHAYDCVHTAAHSHGHVRVAYL